MVPGHEWMSATRREAFKVREHVEDLLQSNRWEWNSVSLGSVAAKVELSPRSAYKIIVGFVIREVERRFKGIIGYLQRSVRPLPASLGRKSTLDQYNPDDKMWCPHQGSLRVQGYFPQMRITWMGAIWNRSESKRRRGSNSCDLLGRTVPTRSH